MRLLIHAGPFQLWPVWSLIGARYDASDRVLCLRPHLRGDFQCFLATATGYELVDHHRGCAFLEIHADRIDVTEIRTEPASVQPGVGSQSCSMHGDAH
ncbi:MAG: hypothetical protein RMN51_10630 [Verrucomicrobiota bacterium]|nr:hypothetical protein [Limisphaera sp.]MDW8382542.1 hypothetical protein [Verrucomicrobiota bacterium]